MYPMAEGEQLPILEMTKSTKIGFALFSTIVGATAGVLMYECMKFSTQQIVKDIGVRLYEDLGIVLKKND